MIVNNHGHSEDIYLGVLDLRGYPNAYIGFIEKK